jgi:hypothetical protein
VHGFLKNYMCYNIVCLSATLKANEVNFPIKAMNLPIGQNRRRGRPNKTKLALQKQDDYNDEISSGSSNVSVSPNTEELLNELGRDSINDDTHNDQGPHDLSLVSINHDQIDRDGDVYEEDKEEEERLVEEERVVEKEKEKEEVSNEQVEMIIFVKEYKKILASTSRRTKINKEYFYSEEFLNTIKTEDLVINGRRSKRIREQNSK